jgi:hypothetical protein
MTRIINGTFANADVDTSESIAELDVRGCEVLFCSFVVGAANLSAFTVEFRVSAAGGYFTVASASGAYTTPTAPVLAASGDLTAAAAGATVHYLKLDVRGIESVRLKAAGTSSTVAGHFGAV